MGDDGEKPEAKLGLRALLEASKSEDMTDNEEEGRQLWWWHGHRPHRHTPSPCTGCINHCSNACYGHCGPGCTKWAACGCGGAKSHYACWFHDGECSCGAMWWSSCLALAVTAVHGSGSTNGGNSGCGG